MSTLNLPAVIARLHGTEQYRRSEMQASRKRLVNLPEVKHSGTGLGNHRWTSIQSQETFCKKPLYLDQVGLLRHHKGTPLPEGIAHHHSYVRRFRQGYPTLLKLDDKPIDNTVTAVPLVKGRNVESFKDAEGSKNTITSFSRREDDDEDSAWARHAFTKKSSRDILRSYEEVIPVRNSTERKRFLHTTDQVLNNQPSRATLVKFSKLDILPPLGMKPAVGDIDLKQFQRPNLRNDPVCTNLNEADQGYPENDHQQVKTNTCQASEHNQANQTEADLVTTTSLNCGKNNRRIGFEKLIESDNNFQSPRKTKVAARQMLNHEPPTYKSTFSRTLPPVSPTTHAGKKLLSSLLARTNKEKRKARETNEARFAQRSSILYTIDGSEPKPKLSSDRTSQKYKNATSFEKLPAEMVGKHFQHTYRNLWNYIFAKENSQKAKSHVPKKHDLKKIDPDVIYIPTGRPEDALSVEKADFGRNQQVELPSKSIKLKYIHRGRDEDEECLRSKDTSPWNIDEQLQTPQKAQNHPIQNDEVLIYYSSNTTKDSNATVHEEGIRKLRITMPMPDVLAPPSTPVLSNAEHNDPFDVKYFHDSSSFGQLHSNTSMKEAHSIKRNGPRVPTLYYPTPAKIVNFKSEQAKSDKEKKAKDSKRKSTKTAGPVSIVKSSATSKAALQSKASVDTKPRLYAHGQYYVKVEEAIIKTSKIKMPKDLNNMFTKPYTFSYLTGVQAPCNLSSQLTKYSKNVANLSTTRHSKGGNHPQTTLVSEMRKVDDSIVEETCPNTQDACTQFDYEYASDVYTGNQVANGSLPSFYQCDFEAETHDTTIHLSNSITSDEIVNASDETENNQPPRKEPMRPLSEGAKEDHIKIYHDKIAGLSGAT